MTVDDTDDAGDILLRSKCPKPNESPQTPIATTFDKNELDFDEILKGNFIDDFSEKQDEEMLDIDDIELAPMFA